MYPQRMGVRRSVIPVMLAWLCASADGPDTGLLAPGGENINVLGEATLRFRITDSILEGSTINLYRQTLNLPFMK
jgi:hypothetical protein